MDETLETRIRELAEALSRTELTTWRRPAVALGRRQLGSLDGRPALRSALFRFVDAAPACRGPLDRGAHLRAFVREVDGERVPIALRPLQGRAAVGPLLAAYGLASGPATALLARQFIAGRDVKDARRTLRGMWGHGQAFALDLLGESTVSEAEAEAYFERCA
jgi:proline dehydrogenase